jgi:pre-mRNA-splicing factor SYF1
LIDIGLKFTKLERKLGEIDRARGIYEHLSQYSNPNHSLQKEKFWRKWEQFEVFHGNEETYKEFMKAKRTVELRYAAVAPVMPTASAMEEVEQQEGE